MVDNRSDASKRAIVAIDLSLSSPGVAIFLPGNNNGTASAIHTFYAPQKRSQLNLIHSSLCDIALQDDSASKVGKRKDNNNSLTKCIKFTINPLSIALNNTKASKFILRRYTCVASAIIECIRGKVPHDSRHYPPRVFIEGYAFGASNSGYSSRLYELCGIFKYLVYTEGWGEVIAVSPPSIKKSFTGNGRSDKMDMLNAFTAKGFPNVCKIFGERVQSNRKVKNPIQDIVDAVALLLQCIVSAP